MNTSASIRSSACGLCLKHVIHWSARWHLGGPNGCKKAIAKIKQLMERGDVQFVIRTDIAGYYVSMDQDILLTSPCHMCASAPSPPSSSSRPSSRSDNALMGIARGDAIGLDSAVTPRDDEEGTQNHVSWRLSSASLFQATQQPLFALLLLGWRVPARVTHQAAATEDASSSSVQLALHPRTRQRARDKLRTMMTDAASPCDKISYLRRWAKWWSSINEDLVYTELIRNWLLHCYRGT